jgi:hypothetical protein
MMASLLSKADPEFATLRRRREELTEKEVRLRAELREMQAQARSQDEQRDIASKLNAALDDRRLMYGPYTIARTRAQKVAAQQIKESASYRKQVLAAASGWAPFLASWAALTAATDAARREGVPLLPIPPGVAAQPTEAAAWLKRQIADGVLDEASLPPALRALIGDDHA